MIRLRPIMAACLPGLLLLVGYLLVIHNCSLPFHGANNINRRRLGEVTSSLSEKNNETKIHFDQLHVAIIDQMANNLLEDTSQIWEFEDDGRPIINTFFEPLDRQISKLDAAVLAVWKHGWTKSGWNPRVLALKDSRKHPDFAKVYVAVRQFEYSKYEMMCYLRYFAMAALDGGGHMSDYDTVPLHMPADWYGANGLPNDGAFTSYANFVPSLLSGRADEWERVGYELIEEGTKHFKDKGVFSDMFALQELEKKKKIITTQPFQVVQPWHLAGGIVPLLNGIMHCERMLKHQPLPNAIHISHATIYDAGLELEDRGIVMAEIMQTYSNACGGPDFFSSAVEANLAAEVIKEIQASPRIKYEKASESLDELYKSDGPLQISRKNKVMFVHIPKTGGSTIERSKLFADKPNEASSHYQIRDFVKQKGVEDFTSFAVVRHPCERAISAFNYLSKGGSGSPSEKKWSEENIGDKTIDEWVKGGLGTYKIHFQPMWRFLFMERDMRNQNTMVMGVDNIFCQEQFDEATTWINNKYGADIFQTVPHTNALEEHATCKDLKPETRKTIEEYYAMDYCIFGYNKGTDPVAKTCAAQSLSKQEFTERYIKCQSSVSVS